ncbi:hypothetical protein AUJ16_01460 [Candidatus Micrarchaeota archaeon CG1_02_60_51]|nr:MAG: hypothetical protein AUJ16_01460 [Candidatus Micrarchaeota archaeon CG1_02_60_51]
MAKARPADAACLNESLALLVRALLLKNSKRYLLYRRIASATRNGVNATRLAGDGCRAGVSEPTARRAVNYLKRMGLLSDSGGIVTLTPLGEKILGEEG